MPLSKAEAIVAAAGPITNFVLAFVLMIIMYALGMTDLINSKTGIIIMIIIQYAIMINIGLGVFNLIPLPPLDGSKILMHFLPYNGRQWFMQNERMFYIIFMIIWISGMSSYIISPIFDAVYEGMNFVVSNIFNLFI